MTWNESCHSLTRCNNSAGPKSVFNTQTLVDLRICVFLQEKKQERLLFHSSIFVYCLSFDGSLIHSKAGKPRNYIESLLPLSVHETLQHYRQYITGSVVQKRLRN